MKVMPCILVAMSLFATAAYAQGNHAQPSAATENATQNEAAPEAQKFGRVDHDRREGKKDDCVGPVSFCNIYFGS
ncbi:hypothetical protein C7413_1154 [Paraburkholderia silvatlantica]|uniref:PsiF repeat-containing protein n=2 Tax=Paraburkholderia silvatlantica TaxID=321895 RepID=A0A2U1A7R6_9BURK|nr:hypothetical protein C7411_1164 [Paraburkholderia silvatlantica]PXW36258.1 hypothetical protein C7413_1154 [Paraburkholderia silvatlantica]PYE21581.1 hypothetical protein C7410_1134 [Paraburkholderia silvatlantica]TDQ86704.1 hypothetical protein C7412_1164 [Paraburkholderia silvatlantica]